jgi:hypothetical protein
MGAKVDGSGRAGGSNPPEDISFLFFLYPPPTQVLVGLRTVGDSRRRIIIWPSNNTVQFYSSVRSGICYFPNVEGTIHLNFGRAPTDVERLGR